MEVRSAEGYASGGELPELGGGKRGLLAFLAAGLEALQQHRQGRVDPQLADRFDDLEP